MIQSRALPLAALALTSIACQPSPPALVMTVDAAPLNDAAEVALSSERVWTFGHGTCVKQSAGDFTCFGKVPDGLELLAEQMDAVELVWSGLGYRHYCAVDSTRLAKCYADRTESAATEGVFPRISAAYDSGDHVALVRDNGKVCFWNHQNACEPADFVDFKNMLGSPLTIPPEEIARGNSFGGVLLTDGTRCDTRMRCLPAPNRRRKDVKPVDASADCWVYGDDSVECSVESSTEATVETLPEAVDRIAPGPCAYGVRKGAYCRRGTNFEQVLDCVTAVVGTVGHNCARDCDGRVQCWGANTFGELGIPRSGVTSHRLDLSGVVQLEAGAAYTCALQDAGAVSCWGTLAGDGDDSNHDSSPRVIPLPAPAAELSIHGSSSCARLRDGRVACWGDTAGGLFWPWSADDEILAPTLVPGLQNVDKIDVGREVACARIGGEARCWGNNHRGQLGQGHQDPVRDIVTISLPEAIVDVSVGTLSTCAVGRSGKAYCWGDVDVSPVERARLPTPVPRLDEAVDVEVGARSSCARTNGGTAVCWTALDRQDLVAESVKSLSVCSYRDAVCTISNDDVLECEGSDHASDIAQLQRELDGARQVSLGTHHGCGLFQDGSVICAGDDRAGQLGTGDVLYASTPVEITTMP